MTKFETAVRNEMDNVFNLEELRSLVLDLGLDWDNLSGETKTRKVGELVAKMMRQNRVNDLIAALRAERPDSDWPELFTETEMRYGKTAVELDEAINNYLDSLRQEVGYVRILGRNQQEPLENVFTYVNLLDKLLAERRYNIDRLEMEANPHDFAWQDDMERISGEDAVQRFDKLFILGKPGAGKTTFLKHTALRAIKRDLDEIPIFVTLKALSDSGKSILEFIIHQFRIHRFADADAYVQDSLQNGKAIVLFDGLDEVNLEDNRRANLIRELNEFIYQFGTCPIMMTCRVAATDYSFTQFAYVEMADFDDMQIGNYIDKWFVDDDVKRERCRRILLENESYQAIRELAQVPLLLALLCLVYEELNEFPPNHAEIYEEATRALLIRWDASRNIQRGSEYEQMSLKVKQRLLAHLAAQTFEDGTYFMREQDAIRIIETYLQGVVGLEDADGLLVLREIEAKYGILVERAHRIHSFSHLTLQEYFKARYIVDNERRGTVKHLMTHVEDSRWDEVFLLVAGMLDDATEFCEQLLHTAFTIIADDAQLVAMLRWVEKKQGSLSVRYQDEAARAFLLWQALIHDLDLANARALNLARASNLARALDGYFALAFDFELACAVATAAAKNLARVSNPTRVFDRVYMLALQIAEQYLLPEFKRDVEAIRWLDGADDLDQWLHQWQTLNEVIKAYAPDWNPHQLLRVGQDELGGEWNYSDEQAQALAAYLQVNQLLLRCMDVAYVPNRDTIKARILLMPSL